MGHAAKARSRAGTLGWLIILCVSITFLSSGACVASPAKPEYGAKVRFAAGRPLAFPDLTLEYAGERHVASAQYPRGFAVHDFVARQAGQEITVSWSAGTGDIGPALFELAGQRYRLELDRSDDLGALRNDELVLWQDE